MRPAPRMTELTCFDRGSLMERLMGDTELARRVIAGFLESMPGQLAAFSEALSTGNLVAVRLAAHSIKGAAGNIGGAALSNIARQAQEHADSGDTDAFRALLPEMKARFDCTAAELERFLDELPASGTR